MYAARNLACMGGLQACCPSSALACSTVRTAALLQHVDQGANLTAGPCLILLTCSGGLRIDYI